MKFNITANNNAAQNLFLYEEGLTDYLYFVQTIAACAAMTKAGGAL